MDTTGNSQPNASSPAPAGADASGNLAADLPLLRPAGEPAKPASPSKGPRRATWAGVTLAAVVGAAMGIGLFTFSEGKGLSYMSNDPSACINCHIMQEQYDGWMHGSHARSGTTCNDCHVPHDSTLAKYYVKAEHGYRHSKGFTLNDFHEPIQITPESRAVVAANCQRCHASISDDIALQAYGKAHGSQAVKQGDALGLGAMLGVGKGDIGAADCLHCHSKVGHGPTK